MQVTKALARDIYEGSLRPGVHDIRSLLHDLHEFQLDVTAGQPFDGDIVRQTRADHDEMLRRIGEKVVQLYMAAAPTSWGCYNFEESLRQSVAFSIMHAFGYPIMETLEGEEE